MNEEELNSMKYRELQKLAKEHGVKANLPKAALIPAILAKIAPEEIENTPEISNVETSKISNNDVVDDGSSEGETEEIVAEVSNESEIQVADKNSDEKKDEIVEPVETIVDRKNDPEMSKNIGTESEMKIPEEDEKKGPLLTSLASLPSSRRNSRLSRLFDKEAFEIEAAKVSRFAEKIINSPRRSRNSRSSILNLTPVGKGQTASAINSPLVSAGVQPALPTPKNSMVKSVTKAKTTAKKVTLKGNFVGTSNAIRKAKDRVNTSTGIPRPRKVPDFAKMHAKQFNKMADLNEYLEKKKERMAALTPGKALKTPGGGGETSKKTIVSTTNQQSTRKSPRNLNPVITDLSKTDFNFTNKNVVTSTANNTTNAKKTFVFNATKNQQKSDQALDNITNKSQPKHQPLKEKSKTENNKYKPHTGKLQPWHPKASQLAKQKMTNRALGGEDAKKKQLSVIKGVRMNKRMELMLQKRNLPS